MSGDHTIFTNTGEEVEWSSRQAEARILIPDNPAHTKMQVILESELAEEADAIFAEDFEARGLN